MNAKILVLDIETTPNLVWSWQTWAKNWNAIEVVQPWYILCVGAKWVGKKTQILSLTDYSHYKRHPKDDSKLLKDLWDLMNEADIIVGWNSKAFDVKKINSRLLLHGFNPPSPYKQVDVMCEKKKVAKSNSNRLADSAEEWGVGRKMDTGGFELWTGCMNGDPKAWAKMKRYCVRDVDITAKSYLFLRPWMTTHPNLNWYSRDIVACSACGKQKTLVKRGWQPAGARRRQIYHCAPNRGGCGKYCTGEMIPQDPNTKLIVVR